LGKLICISGVSGSGKSTLVSDILYRRMAQHFYRAKDRAGAAREVSGLNFIDKVINVDQSPIGRTPRSNPATYTGVFTYIRELFSEMPEARVRGYKPGRFSFNVKGGRCENCEGDGMLQISMQFLPDVYVPCDECHGARFNEETLAVRYKGKSIAEVLALSVSEAREFLSAHAPIVHNTDAMRSADWLVDLGPEGGDKGGNLVAAGRPEDLARNRASYTGRFLAALSAPAKVAA